MSDGDAWFDVIKRHTEAGAKHDKFNQQIHCFPSLKCRMPYFCCLFTGRSFGDFRPCILVRQRLRMERPARGAAESTNRAQKVILIRRNCDNMILFEHRYPHWTFGRNCLDVAASFSPCQGKPLAGKFLRSKNFTSFCFGDVMES